MFPNAIAIVLALVEIIIYLNYKRKYPAIGEKDFSSTIDIETTSTEEANKKGETQTKIDDEDVKGKERPVKIITKS